MPRSVVSADPPISTNRQTYWVGDFRIWPYHKVHTMRKPMDVHCSCGVRDRTEQHGVKVTRYSCEHLSTLVDWLEKDRAGQREVIEIERRWRSMKLTAEAAAAELRELVDAGNPHADAPLRYVEQRLSKDPLFARDEEPPNLAAELFG